MVNVNAAIKRNNGGLPLVIRVMATYIYIIVEVDVRGCKYVLK